jgi:hypothetical protein
MDERDLQAYPYAATCMYREDVELSGCLQQHHYRSLGCFKRHRWRVQR